MNRVKVELPQEQLAEKAQIPTLVSGALVEQARIRSFPMNLGDQFKAVLVTADEFDVIFKRNVGEVFPNLNRRPRFEVSQQRKQRVLELTQYFNENGHRDYLLLEKDGEICGWFCGEQSDPSTYYLRNAGLLPAFQHKGLAKEFIPKFLAYLKEIGYERVTSRHKGDNSIVLIRMLKAGFVLSGLELDERWGNLFKMSKMLNDDRMEAFNERFF